MQEMTRNGIRENDVSIFLLLFLLNILIPNKLILLLNLTTPYIHTYIHATRIITA